MNTYKAIIIHPDVKGGRCGGNVTININDITFVSDDINFTYKLDEIKVNGGGSGDRYIFFTLKNNPNISIYTDDKKVLKDEHLKFHPALIAEVKQAKKTANRFWKYTILTISIFLLTVVGLYLLKDKMVEKLAKQVPIEWENTAGDKLFNTMSLNYKFIKNDSLKKEFLSIAEPLFNEIKKQGYTVDLYFVNDPTINAFALPGGKVIVQTGLIQNAKNWEEVMGVLAHELAHVTRRHHIRGIINNLGIFALLSITLGDVSALAGTFANVGGELATLSNSREFEREADETGWDYLIKAKINPHGLTSFFETIKKENKLDSAIGNSVDLSFLSTHPKTQERIDNLKKKEKKLTTKFEALPNTLEEFKIKMNKSK